MRKIVFLEGLPGVGKTTLINEIKERNFVDVYTVDEIVMDSLKNVISNDEKDYMKNDEMKINKYNEGLIIIDRGPISTLSYNQANSIIESDFDATPVILWFENIKQIFEENTKIVYLTNYGNNYYLPYNKENDAFGTIENQKLLESISLYNCKRYSNNVVVKEYHKKDVEAIINEIID